MSAGSLSPSFTSDRGSQVIQGSFGVMVESLAFLQQTFPRSENTGSSGSPLRICSLAV